MSATVADQSPSQLIHSKQLPDNGFEKDPMAKRETLELMRAYYNILEPAVRRRLRELVLSVAKNG